MSTTQPTTILEAIAADETTGLPIPDAATRETIGYAPVHSLADLDAAVAAARSAQPAWAALGHGERSAILNAIADEIEANAEELAVLLSREQGKPLDGPNARFEVGACAAWTRNAADTAFEPEVVFEDGSARAELHYEPLGVVGAIGPWNWPMMISVWQIAPSLRMGNTVVVKPSEYTPLSVLALAEVFNRHLPQGVLTVVAGDREVGAAIAAHPGLDKIMFTGSTATGRKIVESSAQNLARLTLELGGNDAGIVLPGTDVAAIADDLFWGCFINTGQTCASLKRLYVHDSVYDEVVDTLAGIARTMPMGRGLDAGNVLGPLQNEKQYDIVRRLVDDARGRGARVVAGGEPAPELGPLFYRATVVADIDDGAALVDEEQFGPVIPVIRYSDVDDAIARANASEQGLGASVWSSDADAAVAVARRIQAGTVWINQHGVLNPNIPFGGTKASGYGHEFGIHGLKAVSAPKVISR
ncbi:acyl-CoA reductase-like NAD-dependent aldehyde dehydrogenase [Agromyces flavus]|uniref:Acyl-CoA reductase-like NAD-dependent aldehyde dehydrogenase n=1 Tax=Agromyces flavus TaxID=589382 RepID=A0A1H1W161_9MICO|nr:aldehyde dehydrogenase family protein [Agromyces flavus]MCP2366064.1 acyl-CoA reductase-like NAD-dependent aldehyde dehydrogenase [Agromyces flavus]GGI43927.1 aldehyde dehydrogenase [Agromyces flavus]SDS91008.1 Aldehyde dehydrogenase family protein [Agromyces flavus]